MFVLFNKDKKFIGYSADAPDNPDIFKKPIPSDKTDFTKWRWDGSYDDGQMVFINENPYPDSEYELQYSLFNKINKDYPIDLQVVYIIKQLRVLATKNNCIIPEFGIMSDLILKAVEKYENQYKLLGKK
jgi:hypothetical protein